MNREIKFRAWDKTQNKMRTDIISIDVYNKWKLKSRCIYFLEGGYSNQEDSELMQFTGLKDKNGVEIYEGDIIEFIRDYNSVSIPKLYKGKVFYDDSNFTYNVEYGDKYIIPLCDTLEYDIPIVIGNIHERIKQ